MTATGLRVVELKVPLFLGRIRRWGWGTAKCGGLVLSRDAAGDKSGDAGGHAAFRVQRGAEGWWGREGAAWFDGVIVGLSHVASRMVGPIARGRCPPGRPARASSILTRRRLEQNSILANVSSPSTCTFPSPRAQCVSHRDDLDARKARRK